MARKMSMPLGPDEIELLKHLYSHYKIPTDQFKSRPEKSAEFLNAWNSVSERSDPWEDVIHYMITKRKNNQWVALGDNHLPMAEPDWSLLTAAEWSDLQTAYEDTLLCHKLGSDTLQYDPVLAASLAREFYRRSKRPVDSRILTGLVMSKRRRGEWLTIRPRGEKPSTSTEFGFDDIDEVA